MQSFAPARQPRHDSPQRQVHHVSDLFVRQCFHFTQHYDLAKLHRQFLQRRSNDLRVNTSQQQHLGIGEVETELVEFVVDRIGERQHAILLQPRVTGVSDNRQ